MAYTLTSDLITNNSMIDTQHKQLFDAINALLEACSKGQGRAEIGKTLDFLSKYVDKHFSDEEKLQVQYSYPEYDKHHKYHEEYKKIIRELQQELEKSGANIALVAKVNTAIGGWLVNHIKREDLKMAKYIREQQK
ncbi:bacteriohemerythrin [Clostridium merdae]|uniref:bacteriohemerythrin n=1 Tax=Clostridium merdae TaxID=1958780 RepID=UPI000A270B90|nr:hemerythrin family protein [Clostridium merdae]